MFIRHLGEKKKKKYQRMEEQKKIYLECFTEKVGAESVTEMRKTIQAEEERIRASYAESIQWMSSDFFVDLFLQDSVFIVEFIIRLLDHQDCREFSPDLIVGHPVLQFNRGSRPHLTREPTTLFHFRYIVRSLYVGIVYI